MVASNAPNAETSPHNNKSPGTDSPTFDFKQKKRSPTSCQKKNSSQEKKKLNFREPEELRIKLNVYDLVWDKSASTPQNAGLAEIGFGFYHSGVELWGKEISFGQSNKFSSGVFAVKPKSAETMMQHTHFRTTIEIDTISISRYRSIEPPACIDDDLPDLFLSFSVDKILNRLALKYKSELYNILRCNCNHFTEELCMALCGKSIPEWVNRPANFGATAMTALSAPIEAVNSVLNFLAPPQLTGGRKAAADGDESPTNITAAAASFPAPSAITRSAAAATSAANFAAAASARAALPSPSQGGLVAFAGGSQTCDDSDGLPQPEAAAASAGRPVVVV